MAIVSFPVHVITDMYAPTAISHSIRCEIAVFLRDQGQVVHLAPKPHQGRHQLRQWEPDPHMTCSLSCIVAYCILFLLQLLCYSYNLV